MKNKAFTLIELLAVIVILAIIALIAVPIVLNIIEDTNKSARMRSVELYLDTAGKSVVAYQLKFPDKKIEGSCEVQANGNLKCDGIEEEIKVEVKGQTGKSGTIVFEEGKIIKVIKLVIGDYEYNMDESGKITEKEPGGLEETDVSCFDYNEKEDGTIAITKYKCGGYYDQGNYIGQGIYALGDYHEGEIMDVVIPSKIDGKTVSSIDNTAFGANSFTYFNGERNLVINSIVIPDSVTSIGYQAFYGNQLTSVKIGNNVTQIGQAAFQNNQLTSIEIPDSVTEVGTSAFAGNKFETIITGNGIKTIGKDLFGEVSNLKNLKIGNSVTEIGDYVFDHNKLTSVIIPDSVTSIGDGAFEYNQLTNLEIPDSVTEIGMFAFRFNQLANVKIGNSVISIGNCSFDYNQLTNLEIPDSVTEIGMSAFQGNRIENLIIGTGITNIYKQAFDENPLKTVKIKAPKSNLVSYSLDKQFGTFNVSNIEWING